MGREGSGRTTPGLGVQQGSVLRLQELGRRGLLVLRFQWSLFWAIQEDMLVLCSLVVLLFDTEAHYVIQSGYTQLCSSGWF